MLPRYVLYLISDVDASKKMYLEMKNEKMDKSFMTAGVSSLKC